MNHVDLVSAYDEADTFVVQKDFMHMSVNIPNDDVRGFVDALVVAPRG